MTTNNASNLLNQSSGVVLGNVRVDKKTASNSAELEFTGLSGSIEQYNFVIDGIIPAAAAPFYMLWSDGTSYLANYAYIRTASQSSGPASSTDYAGNQNQIVLSNINNVQVSYSFGVMGNVMLQGHAEASLFARASWNINYLGTSVANTNLISSQGWAYCADQPTKTITKVKFLFDGQNISSGSITCYGQVI